MLPGGRSDAGVGSSVAIERDARPLYERLLNHAWAQLAEPVRLLHATHSTVRARGHLRIVHGRGYIAWLVGRILRLPRATEAAETLLTITSHGDCERWLRVFDRRRLQTSQCDRAGDLVERFGLLEFRFRLHAPDGSLRYAQRDAAVRVGAWRVAIPVSWAPRVEAREDPAGPQRIKVTVRVSLPWVGQLIAYSGLIEIEEPSP